MAGDVGGALREFFKAVQKWMSGSERRRLRKAIDVAEKAFRRYRRLTPSSNRDLRIDKYIDRFYDVLS